MKKFTAALCLMILFLLLLALTACDNSQKKLFLVENGTTEYRIVVGEYASEQERAAAILLYDVLKTATGVNIEIKDDWLSEKQGEQPYEYEILVGSTNRAESAEALASLYPYGGFYGQIGTKIVICAYDSTQIEEIMDTFIKEALALDPEYDYTDKLTFVGMTENLQITMSVSEAESFVPLDGILTEENGNYFLKNNGFTLCFIKNSRSYGVTVLDSNSGKVIYRADTPAGILTYRSSTSEKKELGAGYDTVRLEKYTVTCIAVVRSEGGAEWRVTDSYSALRESESFHFDRKVEMLSKGSDVSGFSSKFSITDENGSSDRDGYEYFIPAVIYKDTTYMKREGYTTLLEDLTKGDLFYVKDTCIGLPLAMARNVKNGYVLTLQHLNPELSGGSNASYQALTISESEKYGSIGYHFTESGLALDYVYPAHIGPDNYAGVSGWITVYHPAGKSAVQTYTLVLHLSKEESFQSAMVDAYKRAYRLENPPVTDKYDMNTVFEQNIEIFDGLFIEFGTGTAKAPGLPAAASVVDFDILYRPWFYSMGYVHRGPSYGYYLYQAGLERGDAGLTAKGKQILDFWTSDTIMKYAVPPTEWTPQNNASGGYISRRYSYLRSLSDGMDAIAQAYMLAKANGQEVRQWYDSLIKFGEFLLENQNPDGSYYRIYNINGTVPNNAEATSKLNTIFIVRYLCYMYEITDDARYYDAAVKAADFSYENIYRNVCKFVGGTDDGNNHVDRESACYSVYGFSAVYDLTGDKRYADALEYALISVMSWVYCYDYAVPNAGNAAQNEVNPLRDGGVIGLSIIGLYGTNIDTFLACQYTEMFKQYIRTDDDTYLMFAEMLQNNTKLTTDYSGELDYLYKGFACEASNCHNFRYYTAEEGVWLPWISVAMIEPISEMKSKIGVSSINDALSAFTREQILEKMGLSIIG